MSEVPEQSDRKCQLPCSVELQGEGGQVLVDGQFTAGVTGVAYRALEALCQAYPCGLTREELNDAASSKDARRALQYLERVEPWRSARVIVTDSGAWRCPTTYRLRAARASLRQPDSKGPSATEP